MDDWAKGLDQKVIAQRLRALQQAVDANVETGNQGLFHSATLAAPRRARQLGCLIGNKLFTDAKSRPRPLNQRLAIGT